MPIYLQLDLILMMKMMKYQGSAVQEFTSYPKVQKNMRMYRN